MGSTDSLDSGKDSAVDEQSPRHDAADGSAADGSAAAAACTSPLADGRRRRGDWKMSAGGGAVPSLWSSSSSSSSSPPPPPPVPAAREHHNRSKSADCCGAGDADGSRRTHAKSLSVGDDSFDHKIQLWRKRADSQGSIDRKPTPAARFSQQQQQQQQQQHHHREQQHHRADVKSGGAPDLVMDLPVRPSSSEGAAAAATASAAAAAPEPDSPDMGTAAERFAKQNQCTLKKYSKPQANGRPELPPKSAAAVAAKPPLRAKPQIFKKPVFLANSGSNKSAAAAAAADANAATTASQPQ